MHTAGEEGDEEEDKVVCVTMGRAVEEEEDIVVEMLEGWTLLGQVWLVYTAKYNWRLPQCGQRRHFKFRTTLGSDWV